MAHAMGHILPPLAGLRFVGEPSGLPSKTSQAGGQSPLLSKEGNQEKNPLLVQEG